MCPIRVEESPLNVDDGLPSPVHDQPRLLCNLRHLCSLKVLLRRIFHESRLIHWIDDDRHPFLRLRNRNLGSVKSCIFLRNLVKVNDKTGCQLSNRNRHTTCPEVIALADQLRNLRSPEHPLKLTLCWCISLLNLSPAHLDRLRVMCLRGSGRTPDSIPSGPSAEQDNHISRPRIRTENILPWSRRYDCAKFHSLCDIIRVVKFLYISGRQSNLVAIGTVAMRSLPDQLLLRQLSVHRLTDRLTGICRTCDTHRLIDIGSAGQRIADRAAQTGCRTAERFYLGRVVVRLVLEIHKPLLGLPIDCDRNHDGARVDFVRVLLVSQPALLLQDPGAHGRQIHQTNIFTLPVAVNRPSIREILPEGFLDRLFILSIFDGYCSELRCKCRMSAVVRPVGIQHTDLCYGRIPVRLLQIVGLDELKVTEGHRKIQGFIQRPEFLLSKRAEMIKDTDVCWLFIPSFQRIRLFQGRQPGINRVDHVALYPVDLLI